jgi:integrase
VWSLTKRPNADYKRLRISGLDQMVREAAQRADIGKRVYPHLLRHSYATEWLRRGGSPLLLAQQLGHENLNMIQSTYSHLTRGDVFAEAMKMWEDD